MAWNNRWRLSYKSLHEKSNYIYIQSEDAGSLVSLTPAAVPLELETDNDISLDACVRQTTGTLRFVNNGELKSIIPQSTFARRITYTPTGDYTFYGYLSCESVTQPWDGTPYEVEIPVFGMLSMLDFVFVEDDPTDLLPHPFASYLLEAMAAVDFDFRAVILPGEETEGDGIMDMPIRRRWFTKLAEEDGVKTYKGISWKEALERTLKAYAYTIEQWGDVLVIKSRRPRTASKRYSKAALETIAAGGTGTLTDWEPVAMDIEAAFQNMSASNTTHDVKPYKSIILNMKLEEDAQGCSVDAGAVVWDVQGYYSGGGISSYLYIGANTTQSNLSLQRNYIDSSGAIIGPVPSYAPHLVTSYEGHTIAGAEIASHETWPASDNDSKNSVAKPSGDLWLTGGANGSRPGSDGFASSFVKVAQFQFANSIDVRGESGTLCISSIMRLTTGINVEPSNPANNTSLYISVELDEHTYWNGQKWYYNPDRTSDPYVFPVSFDANGNIKTNVSDVPIYRRLSYEGADGYMLPFDSEYKANVFQFGIYAPKITIYSPFQMSPDKFVILKNFSMDFCPVEAVNAKSEITRKISNGAEHGDDVTISLDTWSGSIYAKFSSLSYQPYYPSSPSNYSEVVFELKYTRRVIILENACQCETDNSVLFDPTRVYTFAGKKYYYIGRTLDTSTDSGQVTLLEYRYPYTT